MKRNLLLAISVIMILILAVSCRKSENATCLAGPGGNVAVVVYAIHNGDTIVHSAQQPDTAFLSWTDAGDPANPSHYDKLYIASPGEDHIHLTNLSCGDYRVRMSAFDTVSGKRYTGSQAISFTKTSGEVEAGVTIN